MSSRPPLLVANVGAEEGRKPGRAAAAIARSVGGLWCSLFEPPAFDWLPGPDVAVAWLNTDAALREAQRAGRPLFGAPPEVVRQVHDKAFAQRVAEREGLVPPVLQGAIRVLEPAALRGEREGVRSVERALQDLPEWARERFTLKPRLGGGGRGRVSGARRAGSAALRGSLERLADRGGALLEPWLDRLEDLSAQLFVAPDGALRLLGTTRQIVSPAGVYRGQRGQVDSRGRVVSGSDHDEALREAAAAAARSAHDLGFFGPCGIDAFSFASPEGGVVLRPLVEFNARFTVGLAVLGLVRRHLAEAAASLSLEPGERRPFAFVLESRFAADAPPPAGLVCIDLGATPGGGGPGLLFARDLDALDRALAGES